MCVHVLVELKKLLWCFLFWPLVPEAVCLRQSGRKFNSTSPLLLPCCPCTELGRIKVGFTIWTATNEKRQNQYRNCNGLHLRINEDCWGGEVRSILTDEFDMAWQSEIEDYSRTTLIIWALVKQTDIWPAGLHSSVNSYLEMRNYSRVLFRYSSSFHFLERQICFKIDE